MKFTKRTLGSKNQKGMAIILAVFTVVLITYLVMEISYETNVEYVVNSTSVNRVKAYYAAKSGMELSLLRIKLYGKIQRQMGKQIPPDQKKLLDMIWSMPFFWPPVLPSEASRVDQDMVQEVVATSQMDASYRADITDEGSKIDINDLNSPSEGLRRITERLLNNIFENKIANDPEWEEKLRNFDRPQLINNIIDWMDSDEASRNGGSEQQYYSDLISGDGGDGNLPPNRGFRTVEELRMVAGMTPEIFDLLKDQITVFGMKAINPNHATQEVLMALDPSITQDVVTEILARREDPQRGGPFVDSEDFWNFVNANGGQVDNNVAEDTPLIFDAVYNFRIRSFGEYANSIREIEAVVLDVSNVVKTVAERVKKELEAKNPTSSTSSTITSTTQAQNQRNSNEALPKGPPRIVYWTEK